MIVSHMTGFEFLGTNIEHYFVKNFHGLRANAHIYVKKNISIACSRNIVRVENMNTGV